MGNAAADPKSKPVDKTQPAGGTQPTAQPQEGVGSPTADPTAPPPATIMRPPLIPDFKPLVLLTEEECRSIIGFGKHMPVFDDKTDATSASGVKPSDATDSALPQE